MMLSRFRVSLLEILGSIAVIALVLGLLLPFIRAISPDNVAIPLQPLLREARRFLLIFAVLVVLLSELIYWAGVIPLIRRALRR